MMKVGDIVFLDGIEWGIAHIGDIDGEERVLLSYRCLHGHQHVRSIKMGEMRVVAAGGVHI